MSAQILMRSSAYIYIYIHTYTSYINLDASAQSGGAKEYTNGIFAEG